MTDAIAELLLRYELGDFSPRVRTRLAAIFRDDPPDALELLAKAAAFVGITGATDATFARVEASSSSRTQCDQNAATVKNKERRT